MSVTTVLGEIDGRDLGVTLPHEHLLIDLRGLVRKPDPAENPAFYEKLNLENLYRIKADPYALEDNAIINEPSVAVQELIAYREAGGRSVVDVTPRSIGRDPLRLREISLRSGVHVVMGCGQYIAAAHEEKVSGCSVEDLAAEIIEEIRTGADGTDVRAGVIGEIGTSEVIALAIPERGPSGAKTTMSPRSRRHSVSSFIPLASTPSSFVIRISGLSFIISLFNCTQI